MLLYQGACLPHVLARAQNCQLVIACHISPPALQSVDLPFLDHPGVSWLTLARHTNVCVQVGNFFFDPGVEGYFRFFPTELDGFQLNRDDKLL